MAHLRTRLHPTLLLAALIGLLAVPPAPTAAQEVPRAALGAGLGVLGGVGITVAKVVARAHWQHEFLHEPGDLIHWQSVSMILAPAAGAAFGLHSADALRGSFIGSASGFGLGVGVGALVGRLATDSPEGPWAGGAIGGGVGLALGGLVGGYLGWKEHEEAGSGGAADAMGAAGAVSLGVEIPVALLFSGGVR